MGRDRKRKNEQSSVGPPFPTLCPRLPASSSLHPSLHSPASLPPPASTPASIPQPPPQPPFPSLHPSLPPTLPKPPPPACYRFLAHCVPQFPHGWRRSWELTVPRRVLSRSSAGSFWDSLAFGPGPIWGPEVRGLRSLTCLCPAAPASQSAGAAAAPRGPRCSRRTAGCRWRLPGSWETGHGRWWR